MNTNLDTKAIRAIAEAASPGPWSIDGATLRLAVDGATDEDAAFIRDARSTVPALCGELDELRATLANERGEGEPPAPGWRWEKTAHAFATYGDEHGWYTDDWIVCRSSHGWVWDEAIPAAGQSARCGMAHTAREAMRAAMTAADKTRSPA